MLCMIETHHTFDIMKLGLKQTNSTVFNGLTFFTAKDLSNNTDLHWIFLGLFDMHYLATNKYTKYVFQTNPSRLR